MDIDIFSGVWKTRNIARLSLGNIVLNDFEAHHDLASTRNIQVKMFRHVRQILQRHVYRRSEVARN